MRRFWCLVMVLAGSGSSGGPVPGRLQSYCEPLCGRQVDVCAARCREWALGTTERLSCDGACTRLGAQCLGSCPQPAAQALGCVYAFGDCERSCGGDRAACVVACIDARIECGDRISAAAPSLGP